jgi:hypothetical protein
MLAQVDLHQFFIPFLTKIFPSIFNWKKNEQHHFPVPGKRFFSKLL